AEKLFEFTPIAPKPFHVLVDLRLFGAKRRFCPPHIVGSSGKQQEREHTKKTYASCADGEAAVATGPAGGQNGTGVPFYAFFIVQPTSASRSRSARGRWSPGR